jgi:hypothetical protein
MKRAILLVTLTVSLAFGSGSAYAFPNNPCAPTGGQSTAGSSAYAYPNSPIAPTKDQSTASSISKLQLFWLLLPALARPIV